MFQNLRVREGAVAASETNENYIKPHTSFINVMVSIQTLSMNNILYY